MLIQLLVGSAPPIPPVRSADPPFAAGEALTYDARVNLLGRVGEATLRVDRACRIDGRAALRLSFDVQGGASLLRVEDATRSWVDAAIGVLGITSGQNKGDITSPDQRSWAFIGKLGFEQKFSDGLRARLTASTYQNDNAGRATLYGDRAGSAYWGVLDNSKAAAYTNGRVNPSFTEEIQAYQINPFLQVGNLELFGVAELARGRTQQEVAAGAETREVWQYAGDAVYRLLGGRLYAAGRYNVVDGELMTDGSTQAVDRVALGAGWFVTPNVLLKGEYVRQTFDGWDSSRILSGGKFDGVVVQGAVTF